jgi:hypothetical protein
MRRKKTNRSRPPAIPPKGRGADGISRGVKDDGIPTFPGEWWCWQSYRTGLWSAIPCYQGKFQNLAEKIAANGSQERFSLNIPARYREISRLPKQGKFGG